MALGITESNWLASDILVIFVFVTIFSAISYMSFRERKKRRKLLQDDTKDSYLKSIFSISSGLEASRKAVKELLD